MRVRLPLPGLTRPTALGPARTRTPPRLPPWVWVTIPTRSHPQQRDSLEPELLGGPGACHAACGDSRPLTLGRHEVSQGQPGAEMLLPGPPFWVPDLFGHSNCLPGDGWTPLCLKQDMGAPNCHHPHLVTAAHRSRLLWPSPPQSQCPDVPGAQGSDWAMALGWSLPDRLLGVHFLSPGQARDREPSPAPTGSLSPLGT